MYLPRPQEFHQPWRNFSEVAKCILCPFILCPLSRYPYFLFVICVSTIPLKSGIKSLTCSNGKQWYPLAACAGNICTMLYRCNLIISKCELSLGSGIVTNDIVSSLTDQCLILVHQSNQSYLLRLHYHTRELHLCFGTGLTCIGGH